MRFDFVKNPVFIILTSLVVGIVFSYYFLSSGSIFWILVLVLCLLVFGMTFFHRNRPLSRLLQVERITFMALFFIAVGMLSYQIQTPQKVRIEGKVNCSLEGTIEEIHTKTTGDRLLVEIYRIVDEKGNIYKNPGKAYITTGPCNLKEGNHVMVNCELGELGRNDNYRNSSNKGLEHKHIYYTAYVTENNITVVGKTESLKCISQSLRDEIQIFIEKTSLAYNTKNFLISLLLGSKNAMSAETRNKFSDAGIAHILAVSGMHIGIISSIILMLLFPLSFFGRYKIKYFIAIPIIWIYVFLTGMAPSTIRAAVMITFYFISLIIERKHNNMAALGWAAIFILIFDPYALFDIGFQLSFVSVFFLLLFIKEINFVDRQAHPRLYNLTSVILITIIATAATWSLISLYFGKIVTFFLPANLLIVPLLPVFVLLCLIYFGFYAFSIDMAFLRELIDMCYNGGDKVISYISSLGNVESLEIGLPTVFLWILSLLCIGLLIKYREKRKIYQYASVALVVLSLATIPLFSAPKSPDGFIIQKSFPYIIMVGYEGKEENVITLPKGQISTMEHSGKKILFLDGTAREIRHSETIDDFLKTVDVVVIGSGFIDNAPELLKLINPDALYVMHSSMTKRKEKKLLEETLGNRNTHSIRALGPYHCFPAAIP